MNEKQIEQLKERVKGLEHETQMWEDHMSPFTDYEGDDAPWITMANEFTALQSQLTQAQAECAALRLAISKSNVGDWVDVPTSSCGTDFLERMQEAEWLLSRPLIAKMNDQKLLLEWHKRREVFRSKTRTKPWWVSSNATPLGPP